MDDGTQPSGHYEAPVEASDGILWLFSREWTGNVFVTDRYEEGWGRPVERLRQRAQPDQ